MFGKTIRIRSSEGGEFDCYLAAPESGLPSQMKKVEVHIFPGVLHGYMIPGSPKAFHQDTRYFSMARALAILDGLRGGGVRQALRQAS